MGWFIDGWLFDGWFNETAPTVIVVDRLQVNSSAIDPGLQLGITGDFPALRLSGRPSGPDLALGLAVPVETLPVGLANPAPVLSLGVSQALAALVFDLEIPVAGTATGVTNTPPAMALSGGMVAVKAGPEVGAPQVFIELQLHREQNMILDRNELVVSL